MYTRGIGRAVEPDRIPLKYPLIGEIEMSKRVVVAIVVVLGIMWAGGACGSGASSSVVAPESVASVSPAVASSPSDVDTGTVPDDGVILTPCDEEDGGDPVPGVDGCFWDASAQGNGRGSDVIVWWSR